jgi:colanic acid/amylovoran biosynthesis glycosyltransferase
MELMVTDPSRKVSRIAYLLSQYPAISHTFFLNEVVALRERGFVIETASVNSIHPPAGGFPPREMAESKRTFYIKQAAKPAMLGVLLKTLVTRPAVVWRGLVAALRLRPWDLPSMGYGLFYLVEAIVLGDWMLRKECTHLHVHFGGPVATVGMLTSIAWEIPYSLTIHGPDEFYDVGTSYLEEKIRLAKFVICISHFCRSQVSKISPVSGWSKFRVCRLGVRTDVFSPSPESGREKVHLVCVGRLNPAKGQMVLLRSFRELLRRGLKVRLSIVGDGVDYKTLSEFIHQNRLGETVTLHGALSHPATRELLAAADLFVLPSFAEGVPVALMEAMSMEVACISTYVAGIPELIESGSQGLLVPPSSESDLTEAIELLVTDPERRRALASAGRRKVLSSYDLSINIERLIEVFEEYGLAGRVPVKH